MTADALSLVHQRLAEPDLAFDPADSRQRHPNPLVGIGTFKPFAPGTLSGERRQVRVATLGPADARSQMKMLLEELRVEAAPTERREYLPPYPGFTQAFDASLVPAESARIDLPGNLDASLAASKKPHRVLGQALTDGLDRLFTLRLQFDVIVFYLPERWQRYFVADGFHLHDHVKVHAASLGLTTQILTQQALDYRCRASVRWRLATALYAKAGGTPYKLAVGGLLDPGAAYLGLAYGIRDSGGPDQQFVVCCSQMFDAEGGGLEFIAHEVFDDVDTRNPLLSRQGMRTVVSRSLSVYADRHAGRQPKQLVVHKQIAFNDDEIAGAVDAWGRVDGLTCVSISRPAWRGVLVTGPPPSKTQGLSYGYAIDRGTLTQLDDHSALLWIAGNARTATLNGKNYLQGKKGTPRPVHITRHVGAGALAEPAAQILALSKMDWNTDSLYSSLPATITYAQVLARVVKTERITNVPYDFRLFM
ncbi:hypothetical protein HFP15_03615 [Amycolatopsis sp. K13G38]|uniref:Nuclease PIN n=1 Tax=Amycolatopsis acididurans TaxID=2724524 RepID=A0ABX1IWV6_9PSEU|nr:hypothetical protein [Amycolatopsis acididurans]NKQ51966.1 hypothetical protein [Amycolatopsis acididurans]